MRILVIEDEQKIAAALKRGLELKGYAVDAVHDADTGLSHALDSDYDIILLDRMLPGSMDGVELARRARAGGQSAPIIMLTARGSVSDKVEGLAGGADDYLVKPFSFDELVARIQALLRRPPLVSTEALTCQDLSLNPSTFVVARAGQTIDLSQKEFALLEYLMRNQGRVVSKDTIIAHVWDGDSLILPNTVEVYVGYLRAKIDKPFKKALLKTKRGFGYILG
ncbi:response regulator transcription factor [Candidatus Saccharibacteria bacterium]|nr:response regulator transcription factor [Candidatus Saccharibacteria bacterium]HPG37184.1 response regulator transcription factor [Candidatus Saccharibacteria bacterium]